MKHLRKYNDLYEAQSAASRLRAFGVLAFVSNEHSRTHSFITDAFSVGLWVVLDTQYSDPMALLDDENHIVENPISEEAMLRLEAEAKTSINYELKSGSLANLLFIPALLILVILGVYLKSV